MGVVQLNDVTDAGLVLKPDWNGGKTSGCAMYNIGLKNSCAGAKLQFNDGKKSWVDAKVSIGPDKMTMVLTAKPPRGATAVTASSYGWGSVPLMIVYSADMDGEEGQLPVLTWNRPVDASAGLAVV